MLRRAMVIGGVVLAARLLTLPRTPWDVAELRFPFVVMVAISVAASVVTAVVLALRDPLAAVLFSLSAAMLVHGVTATTDALAVMFIAAVWTTGVSVTDAGAATALARFKPALLALFCAGAIACRPDWTLSVLGLLVASRVGWASFFVLAAAPFVRIPEELALPHDFSVARFVLHPWGSKLAFVPVLLAVAAGVWRAWKRTELEPLAWFTLVHLAVGLALVDPHDGVRYALPALILFAIVAAEGLKMLRLSWVGAAVIAALSIVYAYPLLRERVMSASPLERAKRAQSVRTEIVEGKEGSLVFSRGDADAWGKLTRVPRHLSVVPLPDYRVLAGVSGAERNEAGESWRWLEKHAELQAPGSVRVTLRLPADAKIERNDVVVNGTPLSIRRGETVTVSAPARVVVDASHSFALDPPDTRVVALQLLKVER